MAGNKGIKILSPTGILGYGFPEVSFDRGIELEPDVIGVDAGSTDPGPYYLGSGKLLVPEENLRRDLEIILRAGCERDIPVIIGSAGGAGSAVHVSKVLKIIERAAAKHRLGFRLGIIRADIPADAVLKALDKGRVTPCSSAPEIDAESVLKSTSIVAQMGAEPVMETLKRGCGVVLCGRCYDPVPFAVVPLLEDYDPGLAYHMGKILECGAIAAEPGSGRDCVLGTLSADGFILQSLNPVRRFTVHSTAAHTLYEKSDPYRLPGPGGVLDLRRSRFECVGGDRVRVSGSRFVKSEKYSVKIEGAMPEGFRTVSIAGVRDPVLIGKIDEVISEIKKETQQNFAGCEGDFNLLFHVYGKDGVMGGREPVKKVSSHELGIVIESVGQNRRISEAVCAYARSTFLHFGYPGRLSTAGNLAFLYSPSDVYCGRVYGFSAYHLLEVDDPLEMFPVEIKDF